MTPVPIYTPHTINICVVFLPGAHEGQKRISDPLELELDSCGLLWMLETKPRSWARAGTTLTLDCPQPLNVFLWVFVCSETGSLCNPSCLESHYVEQAGLKLCVPLLPKWWECTSPQMAKSGFIIVLGIEPELVCARQALQPWLGL